MTTGVKILDMTMQVGGLGTSHTSDFLYQHTLNNEVLIPLVASF